MLPFLFFIFSISTTYSIVSCPPGTYTSPLGNCVTCLPGFFCEPFQAQPTVCPNGFFCAAGSAFPIKCPPGFYCPLGTALATPYPLATAL